MRKRTAFVRRVRKVQPRRDNVGRLVKVPRLIDKRVETTYGTGRGDEVTPTSASTYFP
jgi:hypothetical protein